MRQENGPTRRLAAFVARCANSETLSREVWDKAAACLLDAIGLAIIARDERTCAAMRSLVTPVSEGPLTARLLADGTRAVLSEAVTANALAVHAHFHDDSDLSSWSHPGSLIVPVAVALGEGSGASLATVLRAITAGYATLVWLGANERVALALIGRGIRTSPTLGTIGAAATASAVLQLDEAKTLNAIGIATSITGGILEPVRVGSDEWRVQNAHAARGGLLAAQLAQRDVSGAQNALEGAKGLIRSMAGLAEMPPEWDADPTADAILGIVAKPYATLGDNMAAVVAAKLVRDAGIDTARVRRITVRIWRPYTEYPGTSHRGPFEQVAQALASTVFATAGMLVYGELEYGISQDRRDDPEILRLANLSTVEPDDEGGASDGSVEVEFDDGSKLRRDSKEAPATLLYHDRKTATETIESRLSRQGYAAGRGVSLADAVYGAIGQASSPAMRDLLDHHVFTNSR